MMIAAALWLAVSAACAEPVEALFGETPPIQLSVSMPEDRGLTPEEGATLSREVEAARAFYLRKGLLVRVEEKVAEFRGFKASGSGLALVIPLSDLKKDGELLRALSRLLGEDPAELKRRFPFPVPNPAILAPGDRPAASAYAATQDDFRMMDRALEGVWKEARLFPGAPAAADVMLQDTAAIYLYSLNAKYPYSKVRRRGRYQVYRLPLDERPPEHELWGCRAGPPKLFPVLERRVVSEHVIRCAPWGAFRRRQSERKTNYRFEEAYLATLIHEFGHIHEDMLERRPTADMLEIRRRVAALSMGEKFDVEYAKKEAYAQWCELLGARDLYPAQFRRLLKQAADNKSGSEHAAGLRAAAQMLDSRSPNNVGPFVAYSSPGGEMTCEIPSDWTIRKSNDYFLIVASPDEVGELHAQIRVSIGKNQTLKTLEAERAGDSQRWKDDDNFSQEPVKSIKVGKFNGFVYSYTTTNALAAGMPHRVTPAPPPVAYRETEIYFEGPGNRNYQVDYAAPTAIYDKHELKLQHLLDTLTVGAPAPKN